MHELFQNTQRNTFHTDSSEYLKVNGFPIKVQVVLPDELERLGIEQLLKSRGAKVLPFTNSISGSESSTKSLINPKADVIILATETANR